MQNNIALFNYEEAAVRVVMLGDPPAPWWVAKDVCDILGYSNSRDALARHLDEDEKADVVIHDGSQGRSMNVINESGLYCLILRSNMPKGELPNAKAIGLLASLANTCTLTHWQLCSGISLHKTLRSLFRRDVAFGIKNYINNIARCHPKAKASGVSRALH